MTPSAIRVPVLAAVTLAVGLGLITGCGSSGGSASSSPAQSAAAAGLPTSTADLGSAGSAGSVDAKVCAAIAPDVAAITKNVSSPKTFPGQCAYDGGATTVTFDTNDPSHSGVTDVISTGGHSIGGIGDGAVWEDGGGQIAPALGAWKGSVSCLVQPDSDVTNDFVTYTGKPPFTQISDADGAAYAQKMGRVCTAVFAAAS